MKGCNAHLSVLFLMYCWNLRKLFRLMDARGAGVEGAHGKDEEEEEVVEEEDKEDKEEEEEEEEVVEEEEDEDEDEDEQSGRQAKRAR